MVLINSYVFSGCASIKYSPHKFLLDRSTNIGFNILVIFSVDMEFLQIFCLISLTSFSLNSPAIIIIVSGQDSWAMTLLSPCVKLKLLNASFAVISEVY